jgi:Tol biopolymer transport system component
VIDNKLFHIAFSYYLDLGNNPERYIMDADDSNITRLTNNTPNDWSPDWAP